MLPLGVGRLAARPTTLLLVHKSHLVSHVAEMGDLFGVAGE